MATNRDFRKFINESYIKDEYELLKEDFIEEGAALDLFHTLKTIKKSHKERLDNFYNKIENNDKAGAKKEISAIISDLEKARNEVKAIDDNALGSKLGTAILSIVETIGKIGIDILSGMASSVAMSAAGAGIDKVRGKEVENPINKENLKNTAIMSAVFSIPTILKTMKEGLDTAHKRKLMIEKEMEKGISEEDAKKRVGSLYKVSIVNYLNSQIKDMKKIQVNIGTTSQNESGKIVTEFFGSSNSSSNSSNSVDIISKAARKIYNEKYKGKTEYMYENLQIEQPNRYATIIKISMFTMDAAIMDDNSKNEKIAKDFANDLKNDEDAKDYIKSTDIISESMLSPYILVAYK